VSFDGADWMKVIDFAIEQGVLGICFEAVERLNEPVRGFKFHVERITK